MQADEDHDGEPNHGREEIFAPVAHAGEEYTDKNCVAHGRRDREWHTETKVALKEKVVRAIPDAINACALRIAIGWKDLLECAKPRSEEGVIFNGLDG